MKYKFKGNMEDIEVITESQFQALSKTKSASLIDVGIKLSATELKLMNHISKSTNTTPESILKDYLKYSKAMLTNK
tara:strand:- start:649 stop:876 length:228 start_codon:yes stop_codon:yes gene_type:complete